MGRVDSEERDAFAWDDYPDHEEEEPSILEQVRRIERGLPGIPRDRGILAQAQRIMRGLPGIPRNRGILAQAQRIERGLSGIPIYGVLDEAERTERDGLLISEQGIHARLRRAAESAGKPVEAHPVATAGQIARAKSRHWIVNRETSEATALPGATLWWLAWAITGNGNDHELIKFERDPRTLKVGDSVDIMPLLKKAAGEKAETSLPEVPEMFKGDPPSKRELWLSRIAAYAQKAKKDSGHKVFVSVQLAQTILETGWGSSGLFKQAWNIGGVKGQGDAGSVEMPTTEYIRGKRVTVAARFAKYSSAYEGFKVQGLLITNNRRYEKAINAGNPEEQIREMHKAGYATDPDYVSKVMDIMRRYKLESYDN